MHMSQQVKYTKIRRIRRHVLHNSYDIHSAAMQSAPPNLTISLKHQDSRAKAKRASFVSISVYTREVDGLYPNSADKLTGTIVRGCRSGVVGLDK